MKSLNAKELLETYHPVLHDKQLQTDLYPESTVLMAIREAITQALDLASEKARMIYHDGFHKSNSSTAHVQIGADNIQIDKQSILDLKSQLL